jgi:molecular chaperone GrpE (heat shock protein)
MKAFANQLTNSVGMTMKQSVLKNLGIKSMSSVFSNKEVNRFTYMSLNKKCFSEKKEENKPEEQDKSEEKKETKVDKEDSIAQEKYKELKVLYNEQTAKMEVLKKKFEEVRNAYLNNVEETEQIKKRNDRELANAKEYAISKFAKDLLDVYDNFNRAMNSVADKDFENIPEAEKVETYKNFLEGKTK